jgi:hypothetical protein
MNRCHENLQYTVSVLIYATIGDDLYSGRDPFASDLYFQWFLSASAMLISKLLSLIFVLLICMPKSSVGHSEHEIHAYVHMVAIATGKAGGGTQLDPYAYAYPRDPTSVLSCAAGDVDCVRLLVEAGASQEAMDDV